MNEKKLSVYLETSFISYLTSDFSKDFLLYRKQIVTHDWWDKKRHDYNLSISTTVLDEIKRGNQEQAKSRVNIMQDITLLISTPKVFEIRTELIAKKIIPSRASVDALHLAISIDYELDFLLTWNCKHIANPSILRNLANYAEGKGYKLPVISTPDIFLED